MVLPSAAATGVTAAEQSALAAFETQFGVRQVDAFVYPSAAVGLGPCVRRLHGRRHRHRHPRGLGDAFRYLKGPVPFEDNDRGRGVYGYLADAAARRPGHRRALEPYLTATIPGTRPGVLVGVTPTTAAASW